MPAQRNCGGTIRTNEPPISSADRLRPGHLGRHVLLIFDAPCYNRLLAGQEHGRTIPLADPGIVKSSQ